MMKALQPRWNLTEETIFDLDALPRSLAVLGGGPIGSELAQAMARLGVKAGGVFTSCQGNVTESRWKIQCFLGVCVGVALDLPYLESTCSVFFNYVFLDICPLAEVRKSNCSKVGMFQETLRPSNGKKFTTTHPPPKKKIITINNMSPQKNQDHFQRKCHFSNHWGPVAASAGQVTLIGRLMPREDDEVRQVMAQVFQRASQLCSIPSPKQKKNNLHQDLQPKKQLPTKYGFSHLRSCMFVFCWSFNASPQRVCCVYNALTSFSRKISASWRDAPSPWSK